MNVNIDTIYPNPLNDEIYSNTDLTDLVQSIERNGQLEPIVVMKQQGKLMIVSGHRRYFALKQIGKQYCDIRIEKFDNPIVSLIEFNRYRTKTNTDILREGRYLEQEYRKQLGGGKGRRTDLKKDKKSFDIFQRVSQEVGIGETNYKKLKTIQKYRPELVEAIDQKKTTITTAYKLIQNRYLRKPKNITKMDKVDFKIRAFLNDNKPNTDTFVGAVKKVYPYNLIKMDTSHLDELNDKRDALISNLKMIKSFDNQEIVRYRKVKEIETFKYDKKLAKKLKNDLWTFNSRTNKKESLKQIEDLQPILTKPTKDEFNILRVFTSSMEWVSPIGRSLKYVVRNESDDRILGVITLGSDAVFLDVREDFIGWGDVEKFEKKKLGNICIANTIVPTQPFGFNLLGGKLLAGLISNPQVRDDWKKNYGDELVGCTTTSLYGGVSMYNSHLLFKKLGMASGNLLIKPDEEHWKFWSNWLKKEYPQKHKELASKSLPKQKLMSYLFTLLDIPTREFLVEQPKGVYFNQFYHNTKEFLNDKITADELDINNKYTTLLDWWKKKASKRYTDLHKKKSLSNDILWYEGFKDEQLKEYLNVKGLVEY